VATTSRTLVVAAIDRRVLVDDRLRLLSQDVPPLKLSDHRPVIGVVEWLSPED
jgi:hypothetical protein